MTEETPTNITPTPETPTTTSVTDVAGTNVVAGITTPTAIIGEDTSSYPFDTWYELGQEGVTWADMLAWEVYDNKGITLS